MKHLHSNTWKCLVVTLSIFAMAQTGLFAQTTGQLYGKVCTADAKPAAFVTITLTGTNKKLSTTEAGIFNFQGLTPGYYTANISAIGIKSVQREIAIKAGETTHMDVVLTENIAELNEVIIRDGKALNERSISIGKIAINPMDLPQSISIIDKELMDKQQVLHVSDVLKNTNGVYLMGTTGGTQEEIAGRGFAFGSTNTFKNGARFNNGVMPETSSLERVEVLKGSAAILFGSVAPGGILNLVTKKPRFDTGGEFAFRWGSYDLYKPSIDVYGALNESDKLAYRFNASYETAGSFRSNVSAERVYANTSVLYKLTAKTQLILEADYLKDNRIPDFGIGAVNYQLSGIARNTFLGANWASYQTVQKSITATLSHELTKHWNLRAMYNTQAYENNQYGTSRPTNIQANGNWTRALQRTATDERYGLAQVDVTGEAFTGALKHQVLVGVDYDTYTTETPTFAIAYNPGNPAQGSYDTINIYNLSLYTQRTDIPAVSTTKITTTPVSRTGLYVQDLISVKEQWKVLLGVRYTYMDTRSQAFTLASQVTAVSKPVFVNAFTPRVGLVYQPQKTLSFFASYANSFSPNNGVNNMGAPLAPSFINQYELGVKNELFKGVLSANITAYKIVNSNLAQTILVGASTYNAAYPTAQELAGEVTSKGIEVDVMTKPINGFSFIGGYSYNDTRYTKSTMYEVGSKLRYNPAHTANVGATYSVLSGRAKGLEAGFGVLYIGDRFAGRNTRLTVQNDAYRLIPLKGFTQVDLTCGYRFKKLGLRMKVSNLLNELNYFAHDDNSINPIAPRQFATTLNYRF